MNISLKPKIPVKTLLLFHQRFPELERFGPGTGIFLGRRVVRTRRYFQHLKALHQLA